MEDGGDIMGVLLLRTIEMIPSCLFLFRRTTFSKHGIIAVNTQLTLKRHMFELCRSIYMRIFFNKYTLGHTQVSQAPIQQATD